MKFKLPAILAVACLAIVALVWYSRPISEGIVHLFFGKISQGPYRVLAKVGEVHGTISTLRSGRPPAIALRAGDPIYHLDQIQIGSQSQAEINFSNGWALELLPKSSSTIEAYRPNQTSSPVLVSFHYGSYKLVNLGPLGMLYVADQNGVRSPESSTPNPKKTIITTPKSNRDKPLAKQIQPVASPALDDLELDSPSLRPEPKAFTDKVVVRGEETLSVEYIESVLGSLSQNFRKCQMNSLRDQQLALGSMLMTFTIDSQGSVESAGILQSNSHDKNLEICAIGVLRRARFKSFKGTPITLTYPLEFK